METLKERLIELEIRYSHQALLIEQLNEVLSKACRRLDLLEKSQRLMREHLLAILPDDLAPSPDE